jgi:uncharacterized protein (TIGR00251 family)
MPSMTTSPFLRESEAGTTIDLYVQPKASKNELAGVHEGLLKVRLAAPPVEGEANKECIKFLAKVLDVPKSRLEITHGHKSRRKTILVRGISPECARNILKHLGVI